MGREGLSVVLAQGFSRRQRTPFPRMLRKGVLWSAFGRDEASLNLRHGGERRGEEGEEPLHHQGSEFQMTAYTELPYTAWH